MKFLRFWFPVIFYSAIIFYASSIPNVTTPMSELHFDLVLHTVFYMPFGFLVARGIFNAKTSVAAKTLMLMTCLASLFYGLSDEFHQFFVVGRDAEFVDLIADTLGGAIGGYMYLLFIKKMNY